MAKKTKSLRNRVKTVGKVQSAQVDRLQIKVGFDFVADDDL